jgi:hypothetical protein
MKSRYLLALAILLGMSSAIPALAQQTTGADPEIDVGGLLEMLQQQAKELQQQGDVIRRQQQLLDTQGDALKNLQTRVDQLANTDQKLAPLSDDEQAIRARLESLEARTGNIDEETTTTYDFDDFDGAFAIPGSSAALRIGGFVKMNYVQSLSALGSQNRFIVGTIPTSGPGTGDPEAALTVQQSRLNFELREETDFGKVRAFIEGDFAAVGDTFRLRHAFGQFGDLLIGKTWSTFVDTENSPEEVDFEGINGRINVRQAQVRWFPEIGSDWNLELSMEDPAPDITGGTGISQIPDFVASFRRSLPLLDNSWSVKTSLLLRTLRARWEVDPDRKEEALGWALTVSGGRPFQKWDPRDRISVQLSYGDGYGRYVNDLSTVGGQDAVFNNDTGDLETLKVFAAYVSLQKWWNDKLRSSFTASFVDIDNPDFQPDDAYKRTTRIGGNLIWSPIPRIDLGTELLWGERKDKDGSTGDASQFQFSGRYRF